MPRPWGVREWVENLAWDLLVAVVLTGLSAWLTAWLLSFHVPWPVWVAAAGLGAVADTVQRWRRRGRAAAPA